MTRNRRTLIVMLGIFPVVGAWRVLAGILDLSANTYVWGGVAIGLVGLVIVMPWMMEGMWWPQMWRESKRDRSER